MLRLKLTSSLTLTLHVLLGQSKKRFIIPHEVSMPHVSNRSHNPLRHRCSRTQMFVSIPARISSAVQQFYIISARLSVGRRIPRFERKQGNLCSLVFLCISAEDKISNISTVSHSAINIQPFLDIKGAHLRDNLGWLSQIKKGHL